VGAIDYSGLPLANSTHPDMLDVHPPFQIDGNFGCAAGIAEMLLQSHDGAIDLLRALPEAWPAGKARGLRESGGFQAPMEWNQGRLTAAVLCSSIPTGCLVRNGSRWICMRSNNSDTFD
jgi:alpha-L-fucosidase 2